MKYIIYYFKFKKGGFMKKSKKIPYSFRITEDLLKKLERYAAQKEIPAALVIRQALKKFLPANISNN